MPLESWKKLFEILREYPVESRIVHIQQAIAKYGPTPNELSDICRKLMTP